MDNVSNAVRKWGNKFNTYENNDNRNDSYKNNGNRNDRNWQPGNRFSQTAQQYRTRTVSRDQPVGTQKGVKDLMPTIKMLTLTIITIPEVVWVVED